MAEYFSKEITEALETLGRLIRTDARYEAYTKAADAYEKDADLAALITEYNVQQALLGEAFSAPSRDEALIEVIRGRIDTLYGQIRENRSYEELIRAKAESDAFTEAVNAELTYYITGTRPCSHNCASCHSDCASAGRE